jgi:hypothetical protein
MDAMLMADDVSLACDVRDRPAESTPMDNSTRTQGPSESVYDVPCCEPADRYSISDPGTYHLAQRQ